MLRFLNIGYGNIVSAHRIIAIVSPESAPIKRLIQEGREQNILLDATYGRKTRAVIIMDDGHIVLSPIQPETIAQRLNTNNKDDKEEISDEG
ncbi:extracellular matrix/biofilm regulator RemA [Ectobacillus polymachus]|uniref:extracellular matrix/biofilm regulator RemA n=1 Tax=Ectobacillus polymachus TaxID=1508806 RepID=UPI003A876D25